jgi:hypothetical protein
MEFNIEIDASKEKVWNTLWNHDTYRLWTSAFSEGSRAETDWKKGSKVLFLNNNNSGVVSTIVENKSTEFMSIKHLGLVKNGVEIRDSEENKLWAGAFENYSLWETQGKTVLHIEMGGGDIPVEFVNYFRQTWPKALKKLKELSEK